MPTVSIIVPVYNTEQYLSRCIDSILAQTFTDFELILIDDGSTDGSGEICDDYAQKDSRIIVIHQENSGVSSARNLGLTIASSKLISFIDADDSIDKVFYSNLIDNKFDVDLIICGYKEISSISNNINNILFNIPSNKIYNNSEIIKYIISSVFSNSNITNSSCNKIYKKSIINNNNLLFSNRKRGEDWLFNIEYLQLINSAIYYNQPLYNYHRNATSAMARPLINQFDLWIENRDIRQRLISDYNIPIKLHEYNFIWINKVINYIFEILKYNTTNNKDIIYKILNNSEFISAIKNCSMRFIYKPIKFFALIKLTKICHIYILILFRIKRFLNRF